MRTIHWNGEFWYVNERPLLKRIRQWLIWLGGWEKANGAGWSLFRDGKLKDPTPISLFGHRATLFGLWGLRRAWADVRIGDVWLVVSRERAYLSADGTPDHAHCWLWGAPADVVHAAEARGRDRVPPPARPRDHGEGGGS